MKNKNIKDLKKKIGVDFFEKSWEQSWTYIKTVVDVVREPMLILDKNFTVLAANEPFYKTFRVKEEDTLDHCLYDLGNGQWKIPELKKILKNILPEKTFFKGFEVAHNFPYIGRKVIIMNGRQLHSIEGSSLPDIILLAMEDVTEMISVAEKMAGHMNKFEENITEQTVNMINDIERLQKEIELLKKQAKSK